MRHINRDEALRKAKEVAGELADTTLNLASKLIGAGLDNKFQAEQSGSAQHNKRSEHQGGDRQVEGDQGAGAQKDKQGQHQSSEQQAGAKEGVGEVASAVLEGITSFVGGLHNKQGYTADEFSGLAESWWDPQGPMAPLHKINPLRTLYLDTHTNLAGKRLLDVGCGGGLFAESMAARGAIVTAIDPSQQLIDIAEQHQQATNQTNNGGEKINYLCCDTYQLLQDPKNLEAFDIISCMEVLEHVDEPSELVASCGRLLKPGGVAYFSTINRTLGSLVKAIFLAEYVLRWLPRGTHAHSKFIPPSVLSQWLEDAAMTPFSIKGISYDLSSMSFQISTDVDVNYLLLARKAK